MVVVFAVIALLFGILTLKSGGSVLFIDGPDRVAAGNYVPYILWFNFIAGFAYIIAGVGLYLWQSWAVKLSLLIAIATIAVFVLFAVNILFGDLSYELRTVAAMSLRSTLWLAIGLLTLRTWKNVQSQQSTITSL
jgi:hypothetical protein